MNGSETADGVGVAAAGVDGDGDVFAELLLQEAEMGIGDVPGLPCRLAVDAVLGRHLVATRPIRAGQLILKCRPLAVGPKASSEMAADGSRVGSS